MMIFKKQQQQQSHRVPHSSHWESHGRDQHYPLPLQAISLNDSLWGVSGRLLKMCRDHCRTSAARGCRPHWDSLTADKIVSVRNDEKALRIRGDGCTIAVNLTTGYPNIAKMVKLSFSLNIHIQSPIMTLMDFRNSVFIVTHIGPKK